MVSALALRKPVTNEFVSSHTYSTWQFFEMATNGVRSVFHRDQRQKASARLPVSLAFVTLAQQRKAASFSIVNVELILEMLRRFLVSAVLQHVEFATLLVEDGTRPDFMSPLLHGRFVLGRGYLGFGLVKPLAFGADHIGFALADGPGFL